VTEPRSTEQLTILDLLKRPNYFLWAYDNQHAVFAPVDRARLHQSIFLDHRIKADSGQRLKVSRSTLMQAATEVNDAPPFNRFILHMAHGGSTLLARAIDLPGLSLVYREPGVLRSIAVEISSGSTKSLDFLLLALSQLTKRFQASEKTVVKANVPVNFILDEIFGAVPKAKVVILVTGLTAYFVSLSRTEQHRLWVKSVLGEMRAKVAENLQLTEYELEKLDHKQRIGALWLSQIICFRRQLPKLQDILVIDSEAFINEPATVISTVSQHFGYGLSTESSIKITQSDLFKTYSKQPGKHFDRGSRMEEREKLEHALRDDLNIVRHWVLEKSDTLGLGFDLEHPLD